MHVTQSTNVATIHEFKDCAIAVLYIALAQLECYYVTPKSWRSDGKTDSISSKNTNLNNFDIFNQLLIFLFCIYKEHWNQIFNSCTDWETRVILSQVRCQLTRFVQSLITELYNKVYLIGYQILKVNTCNNWFKIR